MGARSLGGGAQSSKKGGRGKEVEVVNHQRVNAVFRKYRKGRQLKTVTSPGARSMERVMEKEGRAALRIRGGRGERRQGRAGEGTK